MEALTIQRMLADYLPDVLQVQKFPLYQHKALRKLSRCRTEALGGHTQRCPEGHVNGIWYNSCKHRACPQCQGLASEEWLRNTQSILLDCPHHHVIFTMPSALNELWRYNRSIMIDILFKATQETLQKFAKDPKYLAAIPGMLLVLHTWGRNLSLHPHIHALISHGGLNASGKWVEPKKKDLFPQEPVMIVFRGKLLDMVRQSLKKGDLVLPFEVNMDEIQRLLIKQRKKDWVVHFCPRYNHAKGVAKYLARYVKGGPFRNQQLKAQTKTHLTFSYQSHQTKQREKLTLSHEAFVQRLVQHVPLPRKQTTRYSGLYTSSQREKLNQARGQRGQKPAPPKIALQWSDYLKEKGFEAVCNVCGLVLHHEEAINNVKKA
jgi:hypothetical protein